MDLGQIEWLYVAKLAGINTSGSGVGMEVGSGRGVGLGVGRDATGKFRESLFFMLSKYPCW